MRGLPLSVALVVSAFAQSDRATVTGLVLDPSGAPIPNADLIAFHAATSQRTQVKTSSTGNYLLPQLPIGDYEISAQAPGFRKAVRKSLVLSIAQTLTLDFTLEVGQVNDSIEVSAAPAALESSSSDLGTVISRERIVDLPLAVSGNMRNPEAFIFLTPGVSGTVTDTQINGSQSRAKEILLDGAGATSPESGGILFTYPSVEAIAEFKLVGSTFNAEYGRTGGGFQIFTTRSGANQFHGALFDYLRNDALDARGFFASSTPVNRQNEFGANLGGPILHNKAFFFANYTGFRFRSGALNELYTLPTAAMRQGDFSHLTDRQGRPLQIYDPATTRSDASGYTRDLFPGAQIPAARFSTVSKNTLALLPALSTGGVVNNFQSVGATTFDRNQVNFRIDYNFSEKSRLSWFSYIGGQQQVDAQRLPAPLTPALDRSRNSYWLRLNHDYVFSPNTLNHFIAGFTREGEYFASLSADQEWPGKLALSGVQTAAGNRFPRILFTDGLTGWADEVKTRGSQVNNALQLNDTLSQVRGSHNLKFGIETRFLQTNGADPFNQMGTFRFNSMETALPTAAGRANTGHSWASFLLGAVDSSDANFLYVVPANRYQYLALFAQDDWKAARRLTINYGLRWDVYFPRTDHYNNMSGFDPALSNPAAGDRPGAIAFLGDGAGRDSSRRSFAGTSWNGFGPRAGFAWSITERTVLRGGYGIYYAPGNATAGLRSSQNFGLGFNAAPAYQSQNQGVTPAFQWDAGFPTNWPRPPFIDPTVGNGVNVNMIGADDGRPPYFQNWSLNLQRQFRGSLLADVGYVGVKGTRLGTGLVRPNELSPEYLHLGALLSRPAGSPEALAAGIGLPYSGFSGSVAQSLRPYPQVLNIEARSNPNGNSTYHALQFKLEKRWARGVSFLGAYTWSKSISDGNVMAGGGPGGQTYYNRALEKAVATTDIPHIVALSGLWELPWARQNRWLGGWSLTAIAQFSYGAPIVLLANNTLPLFNSTLRPDIVPGEKLNPDRSDFDPNRDRWINPAAFTVPQSLDFGNSPRSFTNLRAPMFWNQSAGILKRTPLTERLLLVFRAEFFNLANLTVFGLPITNGSQSANISNTDFGRISRQANTPRQGQFALRLEF